MIDNAQSSDGHKCLETISNTSAKIIHFHNHSDDIKVSITLIILMDEFTYTIVFYFISNMLRIRMSQKAMNVDCDEEHCHMLLFFLVQPTLISTLVYAIIQTTNTLQHDKHSLVLFQNRYLLMYISMLSYSTVTVFKLHISIHTASFKLKSYSYTVTEMNQIKVPALRNTIRDQT